MFPEGTRANPSDAQLSGVSLRVAARTVDERIFCALGERTPSTAGELAEACGLEAATVEARLDALAAHYRVLFNPLTKRYSLPKTRPGAGLAA